MSNPIPPTPQAATINRLKYLESILKLERDGLLLAWPCLQQAKPGASADEDALIEAAVGEIASFYFKMDALVKDIRRRIRAQNGNNQPTQRK